MAELQPPATDSIRITSAGKMKNYVQHALQFFEKNPQGTLTLHTLPATTATSKTTAEPKPNSEPQPQTKKEGLHPCTATIPRLISVVEIIKREFVNWLTETRSTRLVGLHQYNTLSTLSAREDEDRGPKDEEERRNAVKEALEGKNHLKIKMLPYMQIVLCMDEDPGLVEAGATYQAPTTRKISKSAKLRARKRTRKDADGDEAGAEPVEEAGLDEEGRAKKKTCNLDEGDADAMDVHA